MKKEYIYIILGTAMLFQSACKKQLDALPKNALVEGNAITSQQTANIALNGVYYNFANASNLTTGWGTNETEGSILTGYIGYGNGLVTEENNQLTNNTSFSAEWTRYYILINSANGVINAVENLSPRIFSNGRRQQILAEAKFMRAYGHFKLLSWFGQWYDITSPYGVILRSQFSTSTNTAQARATVKDSYDFILKDINYAVDSAAATSANINANKWTAMALKMRVLLSRGQVSDYADCAALGNAIITNGPYKLEANLKDIFYTKGLSSTEVMLGIQPQANQGAYYYNTSGIYIAHSAYYVAMPLLKSLLSTDPRASWILGPPGAYKKGYYFIKYVQPALTTTQLSEVAYAFRLSEVYLMEAEAIARSGGDLNSAKSLLKTVMSKAGVTDFSAVDAAATTNDLLVQLYYEYARNLVGEDGQEYWALLRLPLSTVTQLRSTITSKQQYILPIPASEFQTNPLVGNQNPGYTK